MPKYKDKSDDCNFSDVIISIGDIRKAFRTDRWLQDAIPLIVDKLEELENRIEFIESHINKDKLVAETGWK